MGDESATTSQSPKVVFYGEGTGTSGAAVTMKTETGGTIQLDVSLPIRNAETGELGMMSERFKRGDFLYISAQNKGEAGSITCRIEVNGKVIDEATSSGAYKIASCQGKVP
ncbi:hypothetical protein ACFPJ1_40410 [Kribbella qitaiheensis]|uniref:hypothetical protein n=1 Tax=Kribbella qitaiheensis TaxID=1544730 RepID=UPI00361BC373